MRLTKLEINGFKSFAKKTDIRFEDGITAIVGPNGSGKSNIVDSIRWVLGEQSAKALRGTKMEDVIFDGTEKLRPLSYCSVTLTFDNSDGRLPIDFSEVSVTRKAYRSGESEYVLNGRTCRLKEINELFRDTGIGKEGYSIIGQGRVDEILSDKSNARRQAFEEAAGVMKYRTRKEEAERKLDNTRKNLERIGDILSELEQRVEPLREQSEKAKQYLVFRDELRDLDLNVFLVQHEKLNERIKGYNETIVGIDSDIAFRDEEFIQVSKKCDDGEVEERKLVDEINGIQTELIEISSQIQEKVGESNVLKEKKNADEKQIERIELSDKQSEEKLIESINVIEENKKTLDEKKLEHEKLNTQLSDFEQQFNSLNQEIVENEEMLDLKQNAAYEAMNRLSEAKTNMSRLETMKTALGDRLNKTFGLIEDSKQENKELNEELEDENKKLEKIKNECKESVLKLDESRKVMDSYNEEYKSSERNTHILEQQLNTERSRKRVLTELKDSYEGYYSSVKNVLRDSKRDMELAKHIEGVIAEIISVPDELESAIEMALGSAMQNIVTKTEYDAKYVIEYLRSRKYGRATFMPLSSMSSRTLSRDERNIIAVNGCLGVASELIGYDEKFRNVIENLLGRTIITENLDIGIELNKKLRSSLRIATLKGDIINQGGSMTGGSLQKREFSILGREREINELNKICSDIESKISAEKKKLDDIKKKADLSYELFDKAGKEVHENDIAVSKQSDKIKVLEKYIAESDKKILELTLEKEQLEDNLKDVESQINEAANASETIEKGSDSSKDDIKLMQKNLTTMRERLNGLSNSVSETKIKLVANEKEISGIEKENSRVRDEIENRKNAKAKGIDEISELKNEIENLSVKLEAVEKTIAADMLEKQKLDDKLKNIDNLKNQHIEKLNNYRIKRDELNQEIQQLRERRHRIELNLNKSEMELQQMQDRIWNDYQLTYDNINPVTKITSVSAAHLRIDELKKLIRELGSVNVDSIEDYENVKSRYDELKKQNDDLLKAENDLNTLINELSKTIESVFKQQFRLIQKNFTEVFTELFGGGRAELSLTDNNDVLNCGIEITAQPPGKNLKLLSLLSGGERALTAIALLFAMLKLKPTAFCILDEIETSLDEVNVSNFANYLKDYSQDTQFIVITHRKGSMEVCNAIYGVAMEEKGVSKIISAKFDNIA